MAQNPNKAFEVDNGLVVDGLAGLFSGNANPSGLLNPDISSLYLRNTGEIWVKNGSTPTSWTKIYPITRYVFNVVATITTTSATDTLLTGMTFTPEAGTYLLQSFITSNNSNAGALNYFSVYVGGELQANTTMQVLRTGTAWEATSHNLEITVNGAQVVEIRWRRSAGTASCFSRSMSLLKVA